MITRLPPAVLFDWDNTLIDTFPAIFAAHNAVRTAIGALPWTEAEARADVVVEIGGDPRALFAGPSRKRITGSKRVAEEAPSRLDERPVLLAKEPAPLPGVSKVNFRCSIEICDGRHEEGRPFVNQEHLLPCSPHLLPCSPHLRVFLKELRRPRGVPGDAVGTRPRHDRQPFRELAPRRANGRLRGAVGVEEEGLVGRVNEEGRIPPPGERGRAPFLEGPRERCLQALVGAALHLHLGGLCSRRGAFSGTGAAQARNAAGDPFGSGGHGLDR